MKILTERIARNEEEAARIAVQAAGMTGMAADIYRQFASIANADKLREEADKLIGAAAKHRYGSKVRWDANRWFFALPRLGYEVKDVPGLGIDVQVCLVASVLIETQEQRRRVVMAGDLGKKETLSIPVIFVHALMNDDLERFAILARDSVWTSWNIPGARPVRLPNEFVSRLSRMLGWVPVVTWLETFGDQGIAVAPLVAGHLFGLAFRDAKQPLPPGEQRWTLDGLMQALEGMAFSVSETREMVSRASPGLRADLTLEEAIRMTLTDCQKGG